MPATPSPGLLRWLVPVLIVVVSLTVGGGLLARELYQPPRRDDGPATSVRATTPWPPGRQPGSPKVGFTGDAAAHPEAEPVRRLLQEHFDAINARDYDRWARTVVAERTQTQPRPEWLANYRSTRDGSILVYRIEAAPNGLTVLIGFTSTQDVADAPPELPEACIRWRLALPLARQHDGWRIDTLPAGSTPEYTSC
ncbi:hypothetical protein FHU38_003880 [Saccharomonospora amisosensis]|uniref:Uncharacterized protein n=1 Tax=Saccharomonospora amisosensis TaxID=1128677 RepID=A0A7X5USQ2_9PSEU|nr:hypothetical protein [Saccharomonospora amisosensis]NIJ13536.1 hypothetical protein [Saccharomonospora amisosensis]